MIGQLRYMRNRRTALRSIIDVDEAFKEWEESCIPSYCHPNILAAYVSWSRLFAVRTMLRKFTRQPLRVLDFGASVGELGLLLSDDVENYEYIEQHDAASSLLMKQLPDAVRRTVETAQEGAYDAIFAIDALEHNSNFAELVGNLSDLLAPGGIFIFSGPTENSLYRMGRRIAGFQGDYHVTTIFDIEAVAACHLDQLAVRTVPLGIPLFRISAWEQMKSAG